MASATPTAKKVSFVRFVDDNHFLSYSDSEQQHRRVGVDVDVGVVKRHKWRNKSFFRCRVIPEPNNVAVIE